MQNRWGRKKGMRRTDGMEWGEQWEETQKEKIEGDEEEGETNPEPIVIRILVR